MKKLVTASMLLAATMSAHAAAPFVGVMDTKVIAIAKDPESEDKMYFVENIENPDSSCLLQVESDKISITCAPSPMLRMALENIILKSKLK